MKRAQGPNRARCLTRRNAIAFRLVASGNMATAAVAAAAATAVAVAVAVAVGSLLLMRPNARVTA